jgi:hypothetical protein
MRIGWLSASILVAAAAHAAGDAPLDRATLRGITDVAVIIDKMDDDLVQQGLSPGTLQTRVEEKLRQADVPVTAGGPTFVGIRFVQAHDKRGPYAVCISVGVYQQVALSRDPKIKTSTQTWEAETVMMADPKVLYRVALDSLDELLTRFAEAWKSVNRKP